MLNKFLTFCFLFCATVLQAKNITVTNADELNAANETAKPGDTILLKNGNWQNLDMELTCNGTALQPIVFKAQTNGQVIIKGKSSLRLGGSYIIVEGLNFTDGYASVRNVWEFRKRNLVGNNCRITNCMINNFNNINRKDENYWIVFYGKNNRIDHCTFIDKTNVGALISVMLDDDKSRLNSHSIDSNYFGIRKPIGGNGGEVISVGELQNSNFYSNTVIKNNLFENCDAATAIISIKSCGNIVRNNVFKECQGAVVLRHGNNNNVEGNIFWGNGKRGTGGVQVINEGNWIVNNYFFICVGKGLRSPLSVMNGVYNSLSNGFLPVRDAVIANNTFYNCSPISLGEAADIERTVQPKNVFVFNNIFYNPANNVLFNHYSLTDSIFFANNFISNKQNTSIIEGFEKTKINLKKLDGYDFPLLTKKSVNILPGSMQSFENIRLKEGFPKKAGCNEPSYFLPIYNYSKQMGISWKESEVTELPINAQLIKCSNAADVYAALASGSNEVTIELTTDNYFFTNPLVITKNTRITGPNRQISFSSDHNLISFFEITGNNSLSLENLNLMTDTLAFNQFINTDSSGSCSHFSININNCQFSGSDVISFFNIAKNSYADIISVSNSSFSKINGPLFNLKDENADKGFYNAEQMVISNCIFEKNVGGIINIYRGGNDESTMGPKLLFTNNKINGCSNNNAELIRLYGVQESSVSDNSFINSNQQAQIIMYEDKVRADHQQKNNTLINSGTIVENKFVTNL